MVVNELQFSDRHLHVTGHLQLSIRTGRRMTFSDRVSRGVLDMCVFQMHCHLHLELPFSVVVRISRTHILTQDW